MLKGAFEAGNEDGLPYRELTVEQLDGKRSLNNFTVAKCEHCSVSPVPQWAAWPEAHSAGSAVRGGGVMAFGALKP